MSSTSVVYDVVVIGGGISGLITAVRAVQLNLCVVVLEQSIDEEYMCNSRLTSGVFHCALNTPSDSVQNLFSKIKKDTNEFASEELAELISQNALSVIRWLQTLGVRFIKGAQSYYEFILSPPTLHHQKEGWRNKGGDNLLKRLEGHLLKAGSCIKRGHRTISIKAREGNQFEVLCQVSVGKEISIKTKNVVIADGGFQNNIELINESITPSPDKVFQRNGRSAYGDGILLSRSLGGDVTGLDGFYGHLLSIDCFVNDALWPNPWLDAIASSGILVTKEGTRFADEGNGGIFLANQVAKLEDPMSCFAIADEKIWTDRGNLTMQGPNPKLIELGGTYFVGATIQELAVRANINESNLSKTVFQYNNSIDKNEVHLLTPIRTKNKGPYFPIMRPPYYAFPVCAGITYTMGGIKTNQFMQVISVTDEPIKGLFAVGACTGGLEGGANIGYVGGLIKSSVMGFKAADFIAQNTHKNNL